MQKRCITFSLRGELATATLAVVLELELKVKDFKVPVAVALGLALALASSCFFFSFLQSNFLCPHFLQWEHLSLGFYLILSYFNNPFFCFFYFLALA